MLEFMQYGSNEPAFIDPAAIVAVVQLPAYMTDGKETGRRTRIEYGRSNESDLSMVLVHEEAASVHLRVVVALST